MALFGSARDASLVRHVNRELINNFIDTQANIYDEADNKVYYAPMRMNCLVLKEDKSYTGDDTGYDSSRTGEFNFLRDDLKDKNIHIEEGDIVEWDNEFYEVDGVGASQYFAGRNPNTDLGFVTGDREEFGLSIAVKVTAHVTRRNRLNIQEVRSGVNKPNSIPRNL